MKKVVDLFNLWRLSTEFRTTFAWGMLAVEISGLELTVMQRSGNFRRDNQNSAKKRNFQM